jgi:transposase
MKKTTISDAEIIVFALQDEVRRSNEARYDHRLHAVLLVAQGLSCRKVAQLLGDSPRAVAYWARRFEDEGLAGLTEAERPGRPRRLQPDQINQIDAALRNPPSDYGLSVNLWDGKTLSAFIQKQFGINLGVRQCQRLFRQFGFRLRKPRPMIAHADPDKQLRFKKNSNAFKE